MKDADDGSAAVIRTPDKERDRHGRFEVCFGYIGARRGWALRTVLPCSAGRVHTRKMEGYKGGVSPATRPSASNDQERDGVS